MKRYGHPNIATFYGYSLNANTTEQYMVYEYTSNGSLDGFFTDDGNRARLSSDTRLSIMYELARTVHFLHVGGCHGWKVFHRDIKSANIYLTDDFTPRLIDCGLSKFVADENSETIPGLVTPSLQNTNGGPAFGSPGYMCPEYVRRMSIGLPCPYIAAYDVYSLGVVLTELILGCVNSAQSTRNGTQFYDVFSKYVQNEDHEPIIGGWHRLSRDADPSIVWNPDVLYLACRSAVQCMAPFSAERLTTKALLDELSEAIRMNAYADR
jgi:serine/threonine protein kinase